MCKKELREAIYDVVGVLDDLAAQENNLLGYEAELSYALQSPYGENLQAEAEEAQALVDDCKADIEALNDAFEDQLNFLKEEFLCD